MLFKHSSDTFKHTVSNEVGARKMSILVFLLPKSRYCLVMLCTDVSALIVFN